MKNQRQYLLTGSRSVGNPSPNSGSASAPRSSTPSSAHTLYWSSIEQGNTRFGSSAEASGRLSPEADFRGVEPRYLRAEAERAYFICMLLVVLGVHVSLLAVWLAFESSPAAVLAAVLASFIWQRSLANGRRAAAMFAAVECN